MRFANAVYTYSPDFKSGDYREGAIENKADRVTFEFYTPYIIGATPPDSRDWGIYDKGGKNGLIVRGKGGPTIEISVDQGATWNKAGALENELDLTDFAKGHRQYFLRFNAGAKDLSEAGITIRTVCQANVSILPRLKDDGTKLRFASSRRAVVSAGPNLEQAKPHIIAGAFNSPKVTLQIETPRREQAVEIYAAAHVASGNPPSDDIKYQIEYSADEGRYWRTILKDWTVARRGEEPREFWSQSMCYGSAQIEGAMTRVMVRFHNSGGRNYLRAEAHLIYRTAEPDAAKVTYGWFDDAGPHTESRVIAAGKLADRWEVKTAKKVQTRWVEMETLTP